ncbi:MAG: OmpA family protein [Woeseiaceae bacterium]|nr:OmpA family protein [Woeseiaceae bacterium]
MRKLVSVITLAALASVSQVQAAEPASKEELVGVGSGAIIGAVAGGPFGFVIGAAIGAKLGDSMHNKNEDIDGLRSSLEAKDTEVDRLQAAIRGARKSNDALGDEVRRLQSLAQPELVDLMQAGIAMDLLFRTDEAVLTDMTGARLAELGAALASMPNVHIQLDGFADERGDDAYNLALSGQRVDFVRDHLVQAGVPGDRISTRAHGESIAQDASIDSLALERRVTLKLFLSENEAVASTP